MAAVVSWTTAMAQVGQRNRYEERSSSTQTRTVRSSTRKRTGPHRGHSALILAT